MKKIVLAIALISLSGCGFEIVDTGNRGITTRFGEIVGDPLPEGLHWYNPITTTIREYEVRENSWNTTTQIFTKDNQTVTAEFTATYYPDPTQVNILFQKFGREHELIEKIIKPVILGSIKDAIGLVIADELVSKRDVVTKSAFTMVKNNLAERGVLVTDLQFTNLDFDDSYERAAKEKVVAIQQAQKAKNDTVKIQEEANQKMITAKADAESMRIRSQALSQNKGLVEFEAVQKWDGKLPQYILGSGSVPFIDLNGLGKRQN